MPSRDFAQDVIHHSLRGASPLGLPYTLSREPLRRLAPFAWLARTARSHFCELRTHRSDDLPVCRRSNRAVGGLAEICLEQLQDPLVLVGPARLFREAVILDGEGRHLPVLLAQFD